MPPKPNPERVWFDDLITAQAQNKDRADYIYGRFEKYAVDIWPTQVDMFTIAPSYLIGYGAAMIDAGHYEVAEDAAFLAMFLSLQKP